MILDTSAVVAIVLNEPEAEAFVRLIERAATCRMSVVNHVELIMVLERRGGAETTRQAMRLLEVAEVEIELVTLAHGAFARQAFYNYGKGRHPAGLNFGACFAYALAKSRNEELLFKGNDFGRTDVRVAL